MAIDTSFLHQLDRFSLVLRKRVTSDFIGQKKSTALGKGLIFSDHRIYAPGDDFKNIDWKVYARTDDFFIKNYEEERNVVVHIILDASASMDFGKKNSYAAMLALGFGYLATKNNEKVQFSTFAEKADVFMPERGRPIISSMVSHLEETKPKGKSAIDECFAQYRKHIGSKALVIVISDFLMDIGTIERALLSLGRHQLKVVQVLDPVEKSLRFDGECDFIDSETAFRLETYVSPRLRDYFQRKLDEHASKISNLAGALGGEFYQITADTSIFDAFYKMLR